MCVLGQTEITSRHALSRFIKPSLLITYSEEKKKKAKESKKGNTLNQLAFQTKPIKMSSLIGMHYV